MNANLEVNDKLNVQVIFDPTVGDILKTTGNGDIKITFDKDGNLNMEMGSGADTKSEDNKYAHFVSQVTYEHFKELMRKMEAIIGETGSQ